TRRNRSSDGRGSAGARVLVWLVGQASAGNEVSAPCGAGRGAGATHAALVRKRREPAAARAAGRPHHHGVLGTGGTSAERRLGELGGQPPTAAQSDHSAGPVSAPDLSRPGPRLCG